jgi:hypothetical protein
MAWSALAADAASDYFGRSAEIAAWGGSALNA